MRRNSILLALVAVAAPSLGWCQAGEDFRLVVSNERGGDLTVINARDMKVTATIPVGKRPRGIHTSPDGRLVYVALSGNPIGGPHDVDAAGKQAISKAGGDDDDDEAPADKSADGIGVVDLAQGKLIRSVKVGSDPEEFDLSKSGAEIYVSNEDVKAASVVDIATGKVRSIIPVSQEPEGVQTAPDGKTFYVTCEANGDVFVIDTASYKIRAQFKVPVRPRNVAFTSNGKLAFIPSESVGLLNVVDTDEFKVLKSVQLPEGSRPMRVRTAPDGGRIYVSNGRAGTVSVLDGHSYALVDTIKVGTRPWGMVLSPDGKYLYTANGPSNDVSVVDLRSDKEIARIHAGQSPWGITLVSAGR